MMENNDLVPAGSFVLPFLSSIHLRAVHYAGVLQAGNHAEHRCFRTCAKKKRHLYENQHRISVL